MVTYGACQVSTIKYVIPYKVIESQKLSWFKNAMPYKGIDKAHEAMIILEYGFYSFLANLSAIKPDTMDPKNPKAA